MVSFYVEPFTLHLSRDSCPHLLFPIVLVPVLVPISVPDTASVNAPSQSATSEYLEISERDVEDSNAKAPMNVFHSGECFRNEKLNNIVTPGILSN